MSVSPILYIQNYNYYFCLATEKCNTVVVAAGYVPLVELRLLWTFKPLKSKCSDKLKFTLVQHLSFETLCYLLETTSMQFRNFHFTYMALLNVEKLMVETCHHSGLYRENWELGGQNWHCTVTSVKYRNSEEFASSHGMPKSHYVWWRARGVFFGLKHP